MKMRRKFGGTWLRCHRGRILHRLKGDPHKSSWFASWRDPVVLHSLGIPAPLP